MRQYIRFSSLRQFSLASETRLAHCTAQKACSYIQRNLNCQKYMWCTLLMTHPSWFAWIQTLGLGMKNVQHQPNSPVLHGSLIVGNDPSFESTPLHYTMHSGLGEWCLNLTCLAGVHGLPPPMAEESTWIILEIGHHQWLWSNVWLDEYSQAHWALRRKCHGTQPRDWTESMSLGGQEFNPLRSNSLNSFFLPLLHSELWCLEALGLV